MAFKFIREHKSRALILEGVGYTSCSLLITYILVNHEVTCMYKCVYINIFLYILNIHYQYLKAIVIVNSFMPTAEDRNLTKFILLCHSSQVNEIKYKSLSRKFTVFWSLGSNLQQCLFVHFLIANVFVCDCQYVEDSFALYFPNEYQKNSADANGVSHLHQNYLIWEKDFNHFAWLMKRSLSSIHSSAVALELNLVSTNKSQPRIAKYSPISPLL